MNLLNNINAINSKNIYMIKKISHTLWFKFNSAIFTGNKKEANDIKIITNTFYNKISSNLFWANKIKLMLHEMSRETNEN